MSYTYKEDGSGIAIGQRGWVEGTAFGRLAWQVYMSQSNGRNKGQKLVSCFLKIGDFVVID